MQFLVEPYPLGKAPRKLVFFTLGGAKWATVVTLDGPLSNKIPQRLIFSVVTPCCRAEVATRPHGELWESYCSICEHRLRFDGEPLPLSKVDLVWFTRVLLYADHIKFNDDELEPLSAFLPVSPYEFILEQSEFSREFSKLCKSLVDGSH